MCLVEVCQAPTCEDGVESGIETGVDCGGDCPSDCLTVDNHWINPFGGCVVHDGHTRCWGLSGPAAGMGSASYSVPTVLTPVPSHDIEFVSMAGGESVACGVATDNEVHCWGISADVNGVVPDAATRGVAATPFW